MIRTAADSDDTESAVSSPFLFPRIKARMESERRRRAEVASDRLLSFAGTVWRFAPALILITTITFSLFWFASYTIDRQTIVNSEVFIGTDASQIERVVFTNPHALSNDEVLAIIMTEGEGESLR
ncbi:MAG TPA: hypothetical protein VMM84_04910 [Pyrinomonadaceae bacterium]|nr:hypothetical protein [Pyrinomonadaceae bacterium]